MTNATREPFGTYALPEKKERIRRWADKMDNNRIGHWGISLLRKMSLPDGEGPYDIAVAPQVNARLWPRTNRCEKRAFAGVQVWDYQERMAIKGLMAQIARTGRPFTFLDVGANVGLYSLFVNAYGKELGVTTRILAVEPDETNRARLETNIAFSNADVTVAPLAISDVAGTGHLGGGETNRGEVKLDSGGSGLTVPIETLAGMCQRYGISNIDALKLDIEGHDFRALEAFFRQAPQTLWPLMFILETGRGDHELIDLVDRHGYDVNLRHGINTVMVRVV